MFDRLFKSEHQRITEMLSAYRDGELSPKEQAKVEKHLAQCAGCAQNLHTLRQTVALLGQLSPVAVPRAFIIRPTPVAPRPGLFQMRRTYVYLRAATAVATILLAVVLAGDAFLISLTPYLLPARAPEVIMREAAVEKVVVRTVVVEKEVPVVVEVEEEVVVEKKVVETVIVEKEMAVEAPIEAPVLESEFAFAATPSPAPAEDRGELIHTPKPLPSPGATAREMEAAVTPMTLPVDAIATAGPAFTPTAMPTAVAEVLPPTLLPQEPAAPPAARLSRLGLALWRVVEAGLLSLVLVLAVATLVAKRRQNIG